MPTKIPVSPPASGQKQRTFSARRNVFVLLIAATVSAPLAAQTGVVPYGYFDLGIAKESGSTARVDRGFNNWLGLKGEERLSSGLAATFVLETRFNLDTGEQERPKTYWQGETTVGIKGERFGRLRLGRAMTPLWQNVWEYEPWMNSGFNASLAAYQTGRYTSDGIHDAELGYADFSRFGDAVFYGSPDFYGMHVQTAIKLETDAAADSRPVGGALSYASSSLRAVFAYERNAHRDDIRLLGAGYRIGPFDIMGSCARNRLRGGSPEDTCVLAGTYTVDRHTIRAGYGHNRLNGDHKLSAGYVYSFSRNVTSYVDLYRDHRAEQYSGMAIGMTYSF